MRWLHFKAITQKNQYVSFAYIPFTFIYVLLNNVILVYSLFLYLQEERYSTRQQLLWIDMPWYLRVLHVFKQIPCYFLLLLFPFFSTCCPWSKVIFRLCLEIGREWQNAIFHSFVLRMRKITIYNMYVFPDVLAFSIYKITLLEFQKNIMSFFILFPYIHNPDGDFTFNTLWTFWFPKWHFLSYL